MAVLGGRPLIDYILQATDGLFQRRLVVTGHESVREYCRSQGVEVLFHSEPEKSDTIRLGITALADCSHCVFCMGDQPLVKRESLEEMLRAAQAEPGKIWRFAAQGVPGAPVLFPRKFFSGLAALPSGEGGGYIIKNNPTEIREVKVAVCELMDIDTPNDLERIEKMLVNFS